MSLTVEAITDARGPIAREWPAWQVPPEAVGEWVALRVAVAVAGGVPCMVDPERWWSTAATPAGEAAQAAAVAGCLGCPVRVECAAYAVQARERYGVWGGLRPADRRPR